MNKFGVILYFTTVALAGICCFFGSSSCSDAKLNISVDSLISKLKPTVLEPIDLWINKDFCSIYNNPILYREDIKNYLINLKKQPKPDDFYLSGKYKGEMKYIDNEFMIAILSMQRLDIDDYLPLSHIAADLYYNKYISWAAFDFTLSGYQDFSLLKNHLDNQEVRSFFQSVADNPNTSVEFRKYIMEAYLKYKE